MSFTYEVIFFILPSCGFVKNSAIQSEYTPIHSTEPSVPNSKPMVKRETYFVYRTVAAGNGRTSSQTWNIAVLCDLFQKHQFLAAMHSVLSGTHYGLTRCSRPTSWLFLPIVMRMAFLSPTRLSQDARWSCPGYENARIHASYRHWSGLRSAPRVARTTER